MSTLWTPGGEVPVDRDRDRRSDPRPPDADASVEPDELRARYEEMQQQVLDAPAADVIVQHAASLYELAALHLSQDEPRLTEARLAIDAVVSLIEGLEGRLGEAGAALATALPQLKMAYVQAADRSRPPSQGDGGAGPSSASV